VIDAEPLAGAAPAGHDFVGDQQDAVGFADGFKARQIFFWRNKHAVGADDRLDDNSGHVGSLRIMCSM
jgi:hypothetical protein